MKRLCLKIKLWWIGPQEGIHADYETLVRLARRCAYDFSHATDYIKLPSYLSDLDYPGRARMWISLFAKGNPGKDYRIRYMMELEDAEEACRELVKILAEHGLENKIPARIYTKFNDIPF